MFKFLLHLELLQQLLVLLDQVEIFMLLVVEGVLHLEELLVL